MLILVCDLSTFLLTLNACRFLDFVLPGNLYFWTLFKYIVIILPHRLQTYFKTSENSCLTTGDSVSLFQLKYLIFLKKNREKNFTLVYGPRESVLMSQILFQLFVKK